MPIARRLTTALAALLVTGGALAAQNAVPSSSVSDPQLSAAAAPAPTAPAPTTADQASVTMPDPAAAQVSQVPFAANEPVGVHSKSSDMPGPIAPPRANRHNQAVTLMIIGGAALLGGAIIGGSGGTLIAVGGIVCGAIGLYQYLN